MATEFTRLEGEGVTAPRGYLAGAVSAGIKAAISGTDGGVVAPGPYGPPPSEGGSARADRLDLGILLSEQAASVAGVFTTSSFPAAPVLVSRERVARGGARGVVFNSGCANACTGEQGLADARRMAEAAARHVGVAPEEMLVASTGVIGVLLPMPQIEAGLTHVPLSSDGGNAVAHCIMTTDSRPKYLAIEFEADGRRYRVGGVAKGAGMIHPNMATMLAFVTTDAAVGEPDLRRIVRDVADSSFNMVSIDRDMSTNDSLYIFANGAAGGPALSFGSTALKAFSDAVRYVCTELAQAIAADGEGATRLIEVEVQGAKSLADARAAARAVAGSNLVKAAVHGADPNWGRVLGAIGYSPAEVDPHRVSVVLVGVRVAEGGIAIGFDRERVRDGLRTDRVRIEVDLGLGGHSATAWGCDLTEQYVVENSAYTT